MKAIVVTDQAAGTAGMTLVERPEPQAAINDVVVQVHASGFVPTELGWPSTWADRLDRDRTPSIPGHELAGVVTALGYGTRGLSMGQRVFGLTDWYRDGTLAEYAAVEARNLAPLPGDVDFTVGASLPISGLTAWQGLFEHGRLQAGQSVLVHGAAGAVGSMVTQLAREAGAYVIGTGRAADRQTVLDFGAKEFVDLDNDALEDVGEVDLVFDVIGGEIGKRSAGLIRAGGTLVSIVGPPEARPADGLAVDFVVESDRAQLSEIVQRVRDRTTADEHRQRLDPRRCRRRLQPDRATQGEDDHPRSSVSDTRPSMHARLLRLGTAPPPLSSALAKLVERTWTFERGRAQRIVRGQPRRAVAPLASVERNITVLVRGIAVRARTHAVPESNTSRLPGPRVVRIVAVSRWRHICSPSPVSGGTSICYGLTSKSPSVG